MDSTLPRTSASPDGLQGDSSREIQDAIGGPSTFNLRTARFRAVGVSPKQFAAMQARLRPGRKSTPDADCLPSSLNTINQEHQILLGIDPSLRGTGYGVIQMSGRSPSALVHGTITCPQNHERSRCLARIHETIRAVIQVHQPTVCVVEGLFFAQNHQTTLIMGEARGAALAAVASCGLEIYEIAPRKMKLAIVGYGAAQKSAVARMVQRMLNLPEIPQGDAADALGLALTFTREQGSFSLSKPNKI